MKNLISSFPKDAAAVQLPIYATIVDADNASMYFYPVYLHYVQQQHNVRLKSRDRDHVLYPVGRKPCAVMEIVGYEVLR